jgi:peptidoglycan/xylan/chitin deacetylase (PgdA/CDA1 family)
MPAPPSAPRVLVVDTAAWFHDERWAAFLSRRHWRRLPSRAAIAVDLALAALAQHGGTATFAVLGELAAREPDVVHRIVAAGHRIANAGWAPVDLATVAADAFAADLARAREAIAAASGHEVVGFRAPWPVPAAAAAWLPKLLAQHGHAYDASGAPGAPQGGGIELATGMPFAAHVVRAAELDADQPTLRGLPPAVVRAHAEAVARAPSAFAAWLAGGRTIAVEQSLGLPLRPAPPARAPQTATAPAAAMPTTPLTVVVPLKDEEEGLPALLTELELLRAQLPQIAFAWLFVDDGSTDRTWPLLQQLAAARNDVQLCRHERNLGVAAAIRTGITAAGTEAVASIDGDLSYDPVELWPMLRLLACADVVTASPYHPAGGVKNVPPWRLALSRTLSRCYRLLLRSNVHTWTSCCRVYRRAAVVDLPLSYPGFLGTAEWLVRVLRRGGRIAEHPCVLEARLFGASKLKVLRTVRAHLGLLWRVLWRRIG